MSKLTLMVLILSPLVSFAGELPAIGGIVLNRPTDCGTRPESPNGCVTPISVSFDALSIGLCDIFSAKVTIDPNSSEAFLVVEKSRVEHCTRPEHAPAIESFTKKTTATLKPGSPIYLANPLLAK